jgi:Lon protease-like protein
MHELPLFPLHTVLYPGMPIRLNIFENRYKRLLQDSMRGERRFGVVLIKGGVEAYGPTPEPHQVGCQAAIRKIQPLSNGRINLLAVGEQRFHISVVTQVEPFLKAEVEALPLLGDLPQTFEPIQGGIQNKLMAYAQKLEHLRDDTFKMPALDDDPERLAYEVCALLQLPLEEKQSLLEIRELSVLLSALDTVLAREIALFEALLRRGPLEMTGAFGLN